MPGEPLVKHAQTFFSQFARRWAMRDELAAYLRWTVQTGRRLTEMQLALASHPENNDFRSVRIEPEDVRAWTLRILSRHGGVSA
jgi:hypothetical protein